MATTRRAFRVPLLVERPAVGSGCCAVPAEDLIRSGLERLDGVIAIAIDQPDGWVLVDYDPARLDGELLIQALAGMGYPPEAGGRGDGPKRGGGARCRGPFSWALYP